MDLPALFKSLFQTPKLLHTKQIFAAVNLFQLKYSFTVKKVMRPEKNAHKTGVNERSMIEADKSTLWTFKYGFGFKWETRGEHTTHNSQAARTHNSQFTGSK